MNRRSALKFLAAASASPFLFEDGFEEPMKTITIPPSVGGINARDSYAAMPKEDAVWLRDFVPEQTYLESAPPVQQYYSFGALNGCSTLIPYKVGATEKLIAVFFDQSSGLWDIKDITNNGAVTTLKNDWDMVGSGAAYWTMFDGKLIMCGGADTPQVYNGSTCSAGTYTVIADPGTLRGAITFKGRVYYWEVNTSSFWYAAAGAYQGALTEFDVGTVTTLGGNIVQLEALTNDGGQGVDDLFVVLMDTGEVLIYKGDDPGSATDWSLVGKFKMPAPIGGRSARKVGGSLFVVTTDGIADLNQVIAGNPSPMISGKVQSLASFRNTFELSIYADLVALVEFPETGSLVLLDTARSDKQYMNLGNASALGLLAVKRASGAWWSYAGGGESDFSTATVAASCVFQGVTYFADYVGGGGSIWVVIQQAAGSESFTSAWSPVSKSGQSFSFNSEVGNGGFTGVILTDFDINGALNNTAFVQPFGGMFGQVTLVRRHVGTIADCWPDAEFPNKYRWYRTDIAVKPGGKM